jgi:hypothetical protein
MLCSAEKSAQYPSMHIVPLALVVFEADLGNMSHTPSCAVAGKRALISVSDKTGIIDLAKVRFSYFLHLL